jgi:proline dehydrogenase
MITNSLLDAMITDISLENTEIAFAHKSNKELKEARFLFNSMHYPWLVKLGTKLTPWAIKSGLPVNGIIRKTIFKQFVGGETMEESIPAIQKMAKYNVQVILDYGVEGKEGESNFDHARDQFIKVINFAATQPNIPYMSVKVTGIARFGLMEKLHSLMNTVGGNTLVDSYHSALKQVSAGELAEWQRVYDRMKQICEAAKAAKVGFLVDAEETWIQDPIDALIQIMMEEYNREHLVLYNTLQMYRHDRLEFLRRAFDAAQQGGYLLGMKLVRGAYMEKERNRAAELGYPSPIQPNKEATDRDYDAAVTYCIEHVDRVGVIVASHNEESNLLGTRLLQQKGLPLNHPHVHFSQLYGMSDNITYNLAKAGCSVSKYLPFGPIKDVVPYLMRRAEENTSVGGQTNRELALIDKELKRRAI